MGVRAPGFTACFLWAALFSSWGNLQATVAVEVVVVFLNMIMPCIVAWVSHREHAIGYAWASSSRLSYWARWLPVIANTYPADYARYWRASRTSV